MISFAELTKQVHLINDMILSDMVCDPDKTTEEAVNFNRHLLATKFWFARISYINKKRYLLLLLQDTRSAWTLSLVLKSMWNCRPKDAVMSVSERGDCFSCYDQVPMDHNRTALPVSTLALTMKNDRMWYLSLEPEAQALVLSELLTIAGGPAMWAVLRRAETLYMRYQEQLLQNLHDCIVVSESLNQKSASATSEKTTKTAPSSIITTEMSKPVDTASSSRRQNNWETNLAAWNATIKAMRQSLKLEELEMTFNDGTKRKIWKVNRVKPDVMETVDFVQLLPSNVGKRVLSFLPRASLGDYARVNKYWAYLIDEYRSEADARANINAKYTNLVAIVIQNDKSINELIDQPDLGAPDSPLRNIEMTNSPQQPMNVPHNLPSEKSGGAYSLRYFSDKLNKPIVARTPIRNMAELNKRMEMRGAADENIWKWCGNIVAQAMRQEKIAREQREVVMKRIKKAKKPPLKTEETEGILTLSNFHFPCPLMKHRLVVPLKQPLFKDPALIKPSVNKKRSLSNALSLNEPKESVKRYSLWTRDVSPLYPVVKIPSHQFPSNLISL